MYFVANQEAQKVLENCPDAQWRLIFALARYGGLRTPSETFALKWGHVDWERGRIHVPSPKTAHHEGKEFSNDPYVPRAKAILGSRVGTSRAGGRVHYYSISKQ